MSLSAIQQKIGQNSARMQSINSDMVIYACLVIFAR